MRTSALPHSRSSEGQSLQTESGRGERPDSISVETFMTIHAKRMALTAQMDTGYRWSSGSCCTVVGLPAREALDQ